MFIIINLAKHHFENRDKKGSRCQYSSLMLSIVKLSKETHHYNELHTTN